MACRCERPGRTWAAIRAKAAVLSLFDLNGRPRLRLRVDSLGKASVEFLDENGAVTTRLPGN
jgi:hypothetical protein